jgi:alpha-galactosidase
MQIFTVAGALAALCLTIGMSGASHAADVVRLEDMDMASAAQDYGTPQVDRSITEKPLTLHGKVFEHGLGAHANFALWIDLKGAATRFSSVVGVDDGAGGKGSVRFKVWVDVRKAADTGVLRGGDEPRTLSVDLAGAKRMILLVTSGGDDISFDHADWADARIAYRGEAPVTMEAPREAPYILTPRPSPKPRINGPNVFGVRPGHPFLFRIPATGDRPMTFAAKGLPPGLALDAETGIITGSVAKRGEHTVRLTARNARGEATRPFKIVVGDTLALTPPMGWNSWYVLLDRVTDRDIRNAADVMVKTGMADHGYSYVNIDDCWAIRPGSDNPEFQGDPRDSEGRINSNKRFPDMSALTDYIHAKGLKAGIYTSPGPLTCAGFVGSYGHEEDDARRFSAWGFDFLKYDWCSYNKVVTDVALPGYTEQPPPNGLPHLKLPYQKMGDILKAQPRDFVYNLCQYGMGDVWKWGAEVGANSWRTTGDLGYTKNLYGSMSTIGFGENGIEKYAGPGHWNDPDYLLLGNITWQGKLQPTPLGPDEQYTYVSLWSMLAAPMFFSGDMTKLDDFTLSLLTNDEVIEVDLDPLGRQGRRVAQDDDAEVWARDLEDGSKAVALFNRGEAPAKVTAKWSDIGVKGPRIVRDLWRQKDIGEFTDRFSADVPRHGVVFVRVRKPDAR